MDLPTTTKRTTEDLPVPDEKIAATPSRVAIKNRMTASTLDVQDITFSKKLQNPSVPGRYQVYVNHAQVPRGRWYVQTPMMRAPFGISRDNQFANASGDDESVKSEFKDTKLTLTLSFGSRNPEVELLRTKLVELENKLLDHAVENSKEWFGKACTREVVESMFNPLVRKHPTGQWPDNFHIKVFTAREDPSTYVLEGGLHAYQPEVPSETAVNVQDICEHITKNTEVQIMFSFSQVYFTGKRGFGISVKAHMIRFLPNEIHEPLSFLDDHGDLLAEATIPSSTNEDKDEHEEKETAAATVEKAVDDDADKETLPNDESSTM